MSSNTVGRSMKSWQIANILVALRQPNQALILLGEADNPSPDVEDYASHCESYARALQYLQKAEEAIEWAKKAYEIASNNRFVRVRLADVLHMTGNHNQSHEIYSSLMVTSTDSSLSETDIPSLFSDLFSIEQGSVPSPVMAIEFIDRFTNDNQIAEFWDLGELEFYDSPYFRMHHAYNLLAQKETARALAKLVALVKEMPWLQEATINLHTLLTRLDTTGTQLMPELQQQLAQTIQKNGWTTEGMMRFDVES